MTGPAVTVLQDVEMNGGAVQLTVADNGTAVYMRDVALEASRLMRVDRRGFAQALRDDSGNVMFPRIDPTGRRIALTIQTPGTQTGLRAFDIWVYDLASGTLTRLTHDAKSEAPEWSQDGQRIAYIFQAYGPGSTVHWQPWNSSGTGEELLSSAEDINEISIGHTHLAVRAGRPELNYADLWVASVDSPRSLRPLVATPAREKQPRVSPDGALLAYLSDETGRNEVYVRPFPGPGGRLQVSTSGGVEPIWSPDNRELFYRSPTHIMSAVLSRNPELDIVNRDTLFADVYRTAQGSAHQNYDVFPNGREFVFIQAIRCEGRELMGIVRWTDQLPHRQERKRQRPQ